MAMASVFLFFFAWFGYNALKPGAPSSMTASIPVAEEISSEDLEVLSNLDLLKEMDDLNKLVEAVDFHDYGPPKPVDNMKKRTQNSMMQRYV